MASELRVDTLKDASGNNSVATSTVASGSAKAWCLFESDGTAAITDSFNFGSITDNGTGDYSFAITNNMSNGNYCVPCGTVKDTGGQTTNIAVDHDNPPSASVLRMLCVDDYTQAQRDGELQSFNVLGDLA